MSVRALVEGWGCSLTKRRGCCSQGGCGLAVESNWSAPRQSVHSHILTQEFE